MEIIDGRALAQKIRQQVVELTKRFPLYQT